MSQSLIVISAVSLRRKLAALGVGGLVLCASCSSAYQPRRMAYVYAQCGKSPMDPSAVGFNSKQSDWNQCAENADRHGDRIEETERKDAVRHEETKAVAEREEAERDANERVLLETEKAKQSECRSELAKLHDLRFPPPQVASCPDSGIPAGTYETAVGALPWVKLEVTDTGCAAYEAFTYYDGTITKEYESAEGTWTRDYNRRFECTVGGSLTAERHAKHRRFSGDCRRKAFDVLSEDAIWTFTSGAAPTVTATTSGESSKKIQLSRTAASVEQANGLSQLYLKQQVESDDQARMSMAFAPSTPPQGVGCPGLPLLDPGCKPNMEADKRNWCAALERLRAIATGSQNPTRVQQCNEAREWNKALGVAAPVPKCLCEGIPDEQGWVARTVGCD